MTPGSGDALESLLQEMESSLARSREYDVRCAFGLSIGDYEITRLYGESGPGDRMTWETIGLRFCDDPAKPTRYLYKGELESYVVDQCAIYKSSLREFSLWARAVRSKGVFHGPHPPTLGWVLTALFMPSTIPVALLSELIDQCNAAEKVARILLKSSGALVMPDPDPDRVPGVGGFSRWLAFLCQLAITHPAAVSYDLRHYFNPEQRSDSPAASALLYQWKPGDDPKKAPVLWEPFGLALRGESSLPPGVYLLSPSRDIRVISIEVVRMLLKTEGTKRAAAAIPSPPPKVDRQPTAQTRRDRVVTMIEAFMDASRWGVPRREIAKWTKIPYKTFCSYLNHQTVEPTWKRYKSESMGKIPADPASLSFEDTQGFSRISGNRD
jgi:hypothetical protein